MKLISLKIFPKEKYVGEQYLMTIYESTNYRTALLAILKNQKSLGRKITNADLAKISGVQPPYISKVFKGEADFSSDQLFDICNFFNVTSEERDYLLLTLEFSRSGNHNRRLYLKNKISEIQNRNLRPTHTTTSKVNNPDQNEAEAYYLDPTLQLLHIFLGSTKYRNDLTAISRKLNLSQTRLVAAIQALKKMRLICQKDGWFELIEPHLHLSSESKICLPHQLLVRLKSLDALERLTPEESFRYSLTFSGKEDLVPKIKSQFLKFMKEIDQPIKKSPPEDIFQINFDLFPW